MQTDGSRELVRQAQAGEPQARERLFALTSSYVDRVVHAPGQIFQPGDSVSDRVQDVCLRVLEKLDQFRGADENKSDDDTWGLFRGWVRQVVRTVSLNALRARDGPDPPQGKLSLQVPEAAGSTGQPGTLDPSAHERSPSSNVRADERAQLVLEALNKLPDAKNREIVRLRFFEGLSLRQISDQMELSYDIVRERYRVSMRRLGRELEGLQ